MDVPNNGASEGFDVFIEDIYVYIILKWVRCIYEGVWNETAIVEKVSPNKNKIKNMSSQILHKVSDLGQTCMKIQRARLSGDLHYLRTCHRVV